MATLVVTDNQLRLIQQSLEFYTKIGIGRFDVIKDHPTFQNHLYEELAVGSGRFNVGDNTDRGKVVEVDPKYRWIKTQGTWGMGEEIRKHIDVDNIKHSTDYRRFHSIRESVDGMFVAPRNLLYNTNSLGQNSSWGIFNPKVDESCREAHDLIQVIRHEFWKKDGNGNNSTVDSSVHLQSKDSNKIKVTLDT